MGGHQQVAGGGDVAGEGAVHIAERLEHQRGVEAVLAGLAVVGLLGEHALPRRYVAGHEGDAGVLVEGVHDLHALGRDACLGRGGRDDLGVADEHGGADALVEHAAGNLEGRGVLDLGQGDAPGRGLGLGHELVDQICHGWLLLV